MSKNQNTVWREINYEEVFIVVLSLILALSIFIHGIICADDAIMPSNVNYNGTYFYCDVDSDIVQETSTWCGVACTLMALTGIERYNKIYLKSGYVRPTQTQIAKEVCINNSAYVYKIVNYLNSLLILNKYKYYNYCERPSEADVTELIRLSLAANRPVILMCYPYKAFGYYNNNVLSQYAHYVVIDVYDENSDTFNIVDPTYFPVDENDLSQYQGRHRNISVKEIIKSMINNNGEYDGWIIYT